jgi:hypothetical protein
MQQLQECEDRNTPTATTWAAEFLQREGESREILGSWMNSSNHESRKRRATQVITASFPCGKWQHMIKKRKSPACELCRRSRGNGQATLGNLPEETVAHLQSAGCRMQRKSVIKAHNTCWKYLLNAIMQHGGAKRDFEFVGGDKDAIGQTDFCYSNDCSIGMEQDVRMQHTQTLTLLSCALDRDRQKRVSVPTSMLRPLPALEQRLTKRLTETQCDSKKRAFGAKEIRKEPMDYMQLCRQYLAKLDTLGWARSYHQRLFHDDFLKACTRSFWKLEPPGQFARDHQRVLRVNSWDHIAQEILISTPRRFGKTISVSMFCAAMLLSCPGVERKWPKNC